MKTRIELLAPAGNAEALHAAVENGADAVYLGGRLFNARQQADNFDPAVLKESLEYAHARDVNIYLTMNTLVSDGEMKQALQFAAEAAMEGIDGIIVQDVGLAATLKALLPGMPLHGSTQMTIYDLDGVKALEEMGFKRAVLAREVSLEEASHIARNTSLEIEAFIHGALCVCYSGQCLMSSIIGGRSGNRGKCAQPCRLPYELLSDSGKSGRARLREGNDRAARKTGYFLSPKDMCSVELIGEIAASGIRSLKIEGRMKSPEYVAVVVRTYRQYLDAALKQREGESGTNPEISESDKQDLLQIFNRGGFSSGYMKGKTGADMMCFEKPNNSGIYVGRILSYDRRSQSAGIRLEDRVSVGDGVEIWTGGSDSPGGVVSSISRRGTNLKTAGRGETVAIGRFKGSILPGQKAYKTTDAGLMKSARESFAGKSVKRIRIQGHAVLKSGRPLFLAVRDAGGHSACSEGTVLPEPALNRPMTAERLKEQLEKTGSTPFVFGELRVEMDEGLSLPVSEINEVRRKALEELLKRRSRKDAGFRPGGDAAAIEQRIDRILSGGALPEKLPDESGPAGAETSEMQAGERICLLETAQSIKTEQAPKTEQSLQIALYLYQWKADTDYAGLGADRIYLPLAAADQPGCGDHLRALREAGTEVFLWLPSVTRGNYERFIGRLADKPVGTFDGILAGNPGTVRRLRNTLRTPYRLAGDVSLNLFNSQSVLEAAGMGFESVALSVELTLQQIHALKKPGPIALEAAVYGRLPLMTSEYCPVGSIEGGFGASAKCSGCCSKDGYRLKDRMGAEFPVLCDRVDCRSTILNSSVLFLPESLQSLRKAGVDIFRMYIWDEPPVLLRELVQLHRRLLAGEKTVPDGYGPLVDGIKAAGFTRGHYFRGV